MASPSPELRACRVRPRSGPSRYGEVRFAPPSASVPSEGLDCSAICERRRRDEIPDHLLLLQHPHVITLGVRTADARSHILADAAQLATKGSRVHETGRGGDVTYHGPGQLVGYPILALEPERRDLHRYVRDIEESLIRALARLRDRGRTNPRADGVWVGEGKVAAIGVRVSRWVTSHGFALNVTTDLDYFGLIVPLRHHRPGRHLDGALLGPRRMLRQSRWPSKAPSARCLVECQK